MRKIREEQKVRERRTLHINKYVLIGVCAVLAASSIFMTVETATSGVEVSNLRSQEVVLLNQKTSLEDTLVKTLSISSLEQKSGEMGYSKPSTLVYVTSSQPVANLP
jgi:hypothetical protein